MTKSFSNITLMAAVVVILAFMYLLSVSTHQASAKSTNGLPATQISATTTVVGPQQTITVFRRDPSCTARIIRTQGQGILLAFDDPSNGDVASTSLNSIVGFIQLASTTVAYDSGIYGCGRVTAFAEASTTITTARMQ